MTYLHIVNFVFPIAAMLTLGYVVDRMCKPVPEQNKEMNE